MIACKLVLLTCFQYFQLLHNHFLSLFWQINVGSTLNLKLGLYMPISLKLNIYWFVIIIIHSPVKDALDISWVEKWSQLVKWSKGNNTVSVHAWQQHQITPHLSSCQHVCGIIVACYGTKGCKCSLHKSMERSYYKCTHSSPAQNVYSNNSSETVTIIKCHNRRVETQKVRSRQQAAEEVSPMMQTLAQILGL